MKTETIKALKSIKESGCMEPYISYIRFPHYRNLKDKTKINFDFPITVLIGQNGTNKSSVLRALYGCPNGTSVGSFWFSTKVDPIDEYNGRSRFIYSYYNKDAMRKVEVIKSRIKRKTKLSTGRERINPDYWEPSRPLTSDDMEEMPNYNNHLKGRTKTRWNAIDKNVVYLDFRSQISAYDKYFYHGELRQTLRNGSKQDFIRTRSLLLKEVVDNNLSSKKVFKGKKEHIYDNIVFDADLLKTVSNILGREYKSIRLVEHKFFNVRGKSVILGFSNYNYSEAFAGSGEFAVAVLVYELSNAIDKSLVLLDEPEVSLHPGAQIRMMEFITQQVKEKYHQVVLGTHSPFIIQGLPAEAVKTLYMNLSTDRVETTNSTMQDEAFFYLEAPNGKKIIYVEDKLAREIVRRAINIIGQAAHETIEVKYFSGGASVLLLKYLPYNAFKGSQDILFLMDGDQYIECKEYEDGSYRSKDLESLCEISKQVFSGEVELNLDSNSKLKKEKIIEVLDYSKEYMRFLPDFNPEYFIIKNTSLQNEIEVDVKEYFKKVARNHFNKPEFEDVNGEEIFACQKYYLGMVDSTLFDGLMNDIRNFIQG